MMVYQFGRLITINNDELSIINWALFSWYISYLVSTGGYYKRVGWIAR